MFLPLKSKIQLALELLAYSSTLLSVALINKIHLERKGLISAYRLCSIIEESHERISRQVLEVENGRGTLLTGLVL